MKFTSNKRREKVGNKIILYANRISFHNIKRRNSKYTFNEDLEIYLRHSQNQLNNEYRFKIDARIVDIILHGIASLISVD